MIIRLCQYKVKFSKQVYEANNHKYSQLLRYTCEKKSAVWLMRTTHIKWCCPLQQYNTGKHIHSYPSRYANISIPLFYDTWHLCWHKFTVWVLFLFLSLYLPSSIEYVEYMDVPSERAEGWFMMRARETYEEEEEVERDGPRRDVVRSVGTLPWSGLLSCSCVSRCVCDEDVPGALRAWVVIRTLIRWPERECWSKTRY
jgi:hypothetical protein